MSAALTHGRPKVLVLPSPEGRASYLLLSPGMEKFVGRYALVPEFAHAGGLLYIRNLA